jgi:acetyltransferase-like isoleucine patch superfamily enzyme
MATRDTTNSSMIHPHADVQSTQIGAGTKVWQYTIVLPGARIGEKCNINAHCFVENDVTIGDDVTVKCGVYLWDGLRVEDGAFIGPNVSFTNDKFPRSKQYPEQFAVTVIRKGASIGAGAVILPGLTVGAHAMVAAGAVVTRSVPPKAIVVGNPARIVGYADTARRDAGEPRVAAKEPGAFPSSVKGVTLHRFPLVSDIRGNLTVGEFERSVPFVPKRYFMVLDVPSVETRGEHAHHQCQQFLICVKGRCSVVADDGVHREEFLLDRPDVGLYLPPMTWGIQYNYSADAVLLVFASDYYDSRDYIRDYHQFLDAVASRA